MSLTCRHISSSTIFRFYIVGSNVVRKKEYCSKCHSQRKCLHLLKHEVILECIDFQTLYLQVRIMHTMQWQK